MLVHLKEEALEGEKRVPDGRRAHVTFLAPARRFIVFDVPFEGLIEREPVLKMHVLVVFLDRVQASVDFPLVDVE